MFHPAVAVKEEPRTREPEVATGSIAAEAVWVKELAAETWT